MRRVAVICATLGCAGCVPPAPSAPAPTELVVAVAATEVIQRANRAAALLGYSPVVADASGGVLVTARSYQRDTYTERLVCRFARGSIAETHLVARHRVTVSVTARGDSAAVVVRGEVEASYPSLSGVLAMPASTTDCQSTGSLEAALAEAVRGSR